MPRRKKHEAHEAPEIIVGLMGTGADADEGISYITADRGDFKAKNHDLKEVEAAYDNPKVIAIRCFEDDGRFNRSAFRRGLEWSHYQDIDVLAIPSRLSVPEEYRDDVRSLKPVKAEESKEETEEK